MPDNYISDEYRVKLANLMRQMMIDASDNIPMLLDIDKLADLMIEAFPHTPLVNNN